ncbi:MAG: class I SAM-dependent DNA methyltransferase [Trueperaceae bacterium]|nr:class I SAM-dependent DNA methyltransferase [Trueperaceae bacterium]
MRSRMANPNNLAGFIWSVADILRGTFKQSQYGRIILPFTLLRRLECVLEPTRDAVLRVAEESEGQSEFLRERALQRAAGHPFYNTSRLSLGTLGESDTKANLATYVRSFNEQGRRIFEYFEFEQFVDQLADADLLYQVTQRFRSVDLSPDVISNHEMGLAFEELIRRFAEASNETAGEHYTPRDVVRLTTSLAIAFDDEALGQPGVIRTVYDPAAGTGGFLSMGIEYLKHHNPHANVRVFGQEMNKESFAILTADMLIKGFDAENIKLGNTLSDDQLKDETFDLLLANPPFGVDWKQIRKKVEDEHERKGYGGRFGPGTPRVSDGSLLFLLHLISKMRDAGEGPGSRIGIILNGSPLFTGGAGSGESEIRRWILERDLLEGIVALPSDMFYNTGIATYVWILSNDKRAERNGKVQLVDATEAWEPMRKSLGSKRRTVEGHIDEIVRLYDAFEESDTSKIFDTTDFGYRRVTIERPLKLTYTPHDLDRLAALRDDKAWRKIDEAGRTAILDALARLDARIPSRARFHEKLRQALDDSNARVKVSSAVKKVLQKHLSESDEDAEVCTSGGAPEPDPGLRDYEHVPFGEDVHAFVAREVHPHVPDAWIDESKRDEKDGQIGIVGYEIPFNRHFYQYQPPRPLEEIDADLRETTERIKAMIERLSA